MKVFHSNKSNRGHCRYAAGRVACAQSASKSTVAYTWPFCPMNWPLTGESLADEEIHAERPMLNKVRRELSEAFHHLHLLSKNAKTPWLRVKAQTASDCIDQILTMCGLLVCRID